MTALSLKQLEKSFGPTPVLQNVTLGIEEGEFVVVVGPSGCGKSTLLKLIAGLEDPSVGEIWLGGRRIDLLPPKDRNVAMVFQDYALYPHMTVAENIGFGLKMKGVGRAERALRVREIAASLQIDAYLARRPKELSGGQRQRVAMGRALARDAELFLFDEPLSNLDAKLRMEMRAQIKRLHMTFGTTTLLVTHDQMEAMTLADRIVCIDSGVIAQVGTPLSLYDDPQSLFVAKFIGAPTINLLPGSISADGAAVALQGGASLPVPKGGPNGALAGREVLVGIRPEHLSERPSSEDNKSAAHFDVAIELVETVGSDTFVTADWRGHRLAARCAPEVRASVGSAMRLFPRPDRIKLFDRASEARLG